MKIHAENEEEYQLHTQRYHKYLNHVKRQRHNIPENKRTQVQHVVSTNNYLQFFLTVIHRHLSPVFPDLHMDTKD